MDENGALVNVIELEKRFAVSAGVFGRVKGHIHAVDDISFDIPSGRSLGLVGESGCGKTTTGKLLARLMDPTDGHIYLNDDLMGRIDLAEIRGRELKTFRQRVQIIFQDPYESLNPRRTIYDTVEEPLRVQGAGILVEREARVVKLLELVGLTPASSFLFRFPHELSGGQRQRVAIARALVVNPVFVIADEPTSMLDVSIRIGVMQLMTELAERLNVSYLYITHDLAIARYMCHEIAVMYLGKIVEQGETEEMIKNPLHPYTQALFSAVPIPNPRRNRVAIGIKGGVSAPIDPPQRCRFYDRCLVGDEFCHDNDHPPLEDRGAGHRVACYKV
ncbi:MAG: oligopeptide ABC transporter ATP-binding protein [Anaerolineae bacterium SM23_ 63]|nr:MAG: oligopeptide ABC transporter ATP-binding protein [Anaerolineae bacterium SM23_ 63]HEY47881.1 ABC transporter ATP-binding protein [Anaerolineae bacterium]